MAIREIPVDLIQTAVTRLVIEANYFLPQDVENSLRAAINEEISPNGREILGLLLENSVIARSEEMPICQDTGYAVIFVELGQDVHITGGDLYTAINSGVREGYNKGYLRKSIVGHPLERINTKDNTPAVVHLEIVPGDKVKLTVAPKGGGSENMSALKMLKPADGIEGVKNFVLETVKNAGPNPCPPIIVGVGIGGTFEKCALLAKKALLRPVGSKNPDKVAAELETQLLKEINSTGIGPQGLGGKITALAVNVELYAAHIASLPVAVNINCHAARHKEVII